MVFHGCGFTGNGDAKIKSKVILELFGERVRVLTGSTDIGQGTDTIFPQIVASILDIPLSWVEMAPHDTAIVPDSGPTVASRTAMVVGGVVDAAARKLHAALQAEAKRPGAFAELARARRARGPLRVEAQHQPDPTLRWDDERYLGDAYPTYAWMATVVDLAVDIDTGEVTYRRLITAHELHHPHGGRRPGDGHSPHREPLRRGPVWRQGPGGDPHGRPGGGGGPGHRGRHGRGAQPPADDP